MRREVLTRTTVAFALSVIAGCSGSPFSSPPRPTAVEAGSVGAAPGAAADSVDALQPGRRQCQADAVAVGPVCIDRYEVTVWTLDPVPAAQRDALRAKIRAGSATLTDLTGAGAQLVDVSNAGEIPGYPEFGNPTADIYAVSLKGVLPTSHLSWLQSEMACRRSGKRLPTNAEWTTAAMGTPNPDTDDQVASCVTGSNGEAKETGSRQNCRSRWGAYDMVGNLWEWTSDWMALGPKTEIGPWQEGDETVTNDRVDIDEGSTISALLHGGDYSSGPQAGVFALFAYKIASHGDGNVGFRCAR